MENPITILPQILPAVHNKQYWSPLITNVVAWHDIHWFKNPLCWLLPSTILSHFPQPRTDQMETTLLQPNIKTDPLS